MATPSAPDPVKYLVAILWGDESALPAVTARLVARWGAIDLSGPDRAFDLTAYYEEEMGANLSRRLIAFEPLASPEDLSAAKLACIAIEDEFRIGGRRRVNLDVGYLDHNKLVLASIKSAGQKIYLKDGVYADLVARYARGRYEPFAWTFPDFKDGRYDAELAAMRERYLEQIKRWRMPI
jgi:hypothetical protein